MLLEFIKNPKEIGAICSSSKSLAKNITLNVDSDVSYIAEIGSGNGVFTKEIIKKINNDTTFFVVEINDCLAKNMRKNFPSLDVRNENANNILNIMKEKNIEKLDVVISGIPWTNLNSKEQYKLLSKIYDSLKDGGWFATFLYAIPSLNLMKFKKVLDSTFDDVIKSPIVWGNFPPAFVYYCQK